MAEVNVEYKTTYKAGDNVYVSFKWMLLTGLSTQIKVYDKYGLEKWYTLADLGMYNDYHYFQLVTEMEITGNGDMYEDVDSFTFVSSTETNTNNNGQSMKYPETFLWQYSYYNFRLVNIDEIKCSSLVTSYADGLFYGLHKLQTAPTPEAITYARYHKTSLSLERTGKLNNVGNYYSVFNRSWIHDVDIDCTNLVNIGCDTFVDGVFIIGRFNSAIDIIHSFAFNGYSVKTIDIGSVRYLCTSAFYNCINLETFSENNYLDGTLEGTPFYICPCIKKISLGDNAEHIESNGSISTAPLIYVPLGSGNNLYNGADSNFRDFQVVEVISNNKLFLKYEYDPWYGGYVGTNWSAGYIYVGIIEEGKDFVYIIKDGNRIVIKSYDNGNICVLVDGVKRYVRIVETYDKNASPVRIVVDGQVKAISY